MLVFFGCALVVGAVIICWKKPCQRPADNDLEAVQSAVELRVRKTQTTNTAEAVQEPTHQDGNEEASDTEIARPPPNYNPGA
jgi:hypothetical protein